MASAEYRDFYRAIHENSRDRPGKAYLIGADDGRAISYRELFATTNRLSRLHGRMGLGANDRVMLLAGNGLAQAVAVLGVLRHGACVSTVNLEMNQRHIAAIIRAVAPRLLIFEEGIGIEDIVAEWPGAKLPLGAWRPDGGSGLFGEIASLDGAEILIERSAGLETSTARHRSLSCPPPPIL